MEIRVHFFIFKVELPLIIKPSEAQKVRDYGKSEKEETLYYVRPASLTFP
jgi:hypothetical protein